MTKYICFIFFLAGWSNLFSQINFTNRNDLISDQPAHSGAPIGIIDLNGDKYDDIIRINQVNFMSVVYQFPDSTAYPVFDLPSNLGGGSWSLCAADINNDGNSAILTGGAYTGISLFLPNSATPGDYAVQQLDFSNAIFLQASNLADINNDGWLDYFGCHDDGPSRIWKNDANGNLFFSGNTLIDLNKFPTVEQNSGNYGSVWTDFDNDGDIDLYIAKCRQGVTGFSDPRRINQLWENDGQQNYSENAASFGLAIGAQSWTGDFGDIDNDGDMDCLITNHDVPSQLFENTGKGLFVDITAQSGLNISGLPIQSVMRDFDNDGFLDILVSGSSTQLFMNNGDGTFTKNDAGISGNLHSFACGDLNKDGFVDFYGGYGFGYNTPTNIDDVLWINDGNDNHYLAVDLEGIISNRPAVGARLELWGPWGVMVREVRAGESYGIVHSLTSHFGLGDATEADRLVVRWPSGNISVIENLPVDTFLHVVETDCISSKPLINYAGSNTLCSGDSLMLALGVGKNILWSNGAVGDSFVVKDAGTYLAYVQDTSGCWVLSEPVSVFEETLPQPYLQYDGSLSICEGDVLTIETNPEADFWNWSNGEITSSIEVNQAGSYAVTIGNICGEITSDTVEVQVFSVEPPVNAKGDTIIGAGSAILTAEGDSLVWYNVPSGGVLLGTGPEFETGFIGGTTPFFVENVLVTKGLVGHVGEIAHQGSSFFNEDDLNGNLLFTVHVPVNWKSVKVFTDMPGKRTLDIFKANNLLFASATLDIQNPASDTIFVLDIFLPPGDYRVTTRNADNIASLGHVSPRFYRSNENINFPYEIQKVLSINGTSAGDDYYYFYDWEIEEVTICRSDRVEVLAVVDFENANSDLSNRQVLTVYPNPVAENLIIESPISGEWQVMLSDAFGRKTLIKDIHTLKSTPYSLDISSLIPGNYWLEIQNESHKQVFIIQKL